MFTFAQPSYHHHYIPYEELAMQQELQRRRQMQAYIRRQQEAEEMERRRREYEAAVRRAEYERQVEAELERRRQAELQRRRQAQQCRSRQSMYDGGLEGLLEALYGGQGHRQEDRQTNTPLRTPSTPPMFSPTPKPTATDAPASSTQSPAPAEPRSAVETEPEVDEQQIDTAPSHAAIQSILSSFATLQSEFTFPTHIDFLPGPSPKLAYTANNAPVHGYEHALTGLLTKLDGVESYGDAEVRRARKEAVNAIERELERLDKMKTDAWKNTNEPQAEVSAMEACESEIGTAEVDPVSVPLPEDMDLENDSTEAMDSDERTVDEHPSLAVLDPAPASNVQTELASPPDVEQSVHAESVVSPTTLTTVPTSHTMGTERTISSELPGDGTGSTLTTYTPHVESLARSLLSPSPSETSESDVELEDYVDVETMSTSGEETDEAEEVKRDGDLELMRDRDLDF
ncbi:BAG domain protein [Rhizoctonia solani]|uniref:BAG domain protein n=1 Tax=Rhizoctonia solani TaxID=456999 RepID=A0A8H8P1M5_9AGAM|nr:BAG domain protein [Rhizoctonia solani]QRW23435.1 BAG domain protein [Rhizoctonia solani]